MNYAYIDESGTLSEHKVMTVSLVLLDGRRVADRIVQNLLKQAHPHLAKDPKALGKKKLHFTDMSDAMQNQIANQLAQEKIGAVINAHWHNGDEERYEVIFARYTKMIRRLLYRGLELTNGELNLVIAQQGGWETYQTEFISDISKAVEEFRKRKKIYRSVIYELQSAELNRGLQLADFYAGTVRKMYLSTFDGVKPEVCSPYNQVQHQITIDDYLE
jgi:hypothetical protein